MPADIEIGALWERYRRWIVEWFVVANLGFLALDIYLAHSVNQFAHRAEWIPFYFSLLAPVLLIAGMLMHRKQPGLIVGVLSTAVGVAGRLLKRHLPVDDNGMMILRYPHAMCRLEMTWTEAVAHQPPHDVVIYGTEGTLVAGESVTVFTRSDKEGETVALDELPDGQSNGPEYFLGCLRNGADPEGLPNADLSRDAQEIMEAGLLSAINGFTVSLPVEHHLFRDA